MLIDSRGANIDDINVSNQPEFAIITACLNVEQYIVQCLDSVQCQKYPAVTHTIIDGGSSDRTIDLIKQRDNLHYWHSKRDKGIADAFNQGMENAKGNVILFLGADDYFVDQNVLLECAAFLQDIPRPWFVYGDVLYKYEKTQRRVQQNFSWRRFKLYSCIPHQAMFVDRWFFEQYGNFDLSYRISMDYEHTARFIRDYPPIYWQRLVSVMRRSGVSSNPLPAHREMERVKRSYDLSGAVHSHMFLVALRVMCFFRNVLLNRHWS